MDAYYEFLEPSRVSHCVGCNFVSPTTKHLVVAKTSLLQVFEVTGTAKRGFKLRLLDQFKLYGTVTALRKFRTVDSPDLDYILVATKAAKVSMIRWDHHTHSIATESLHYYEKSIQAATYETLDETDLIVEPNRYSCFCVRFKNLLTFLPFTTPDDDDDDMDDDGEAKKQNYVGGFDSEAFGASFMVDAQSLEPSIGTIVDMQFLHNYREPTVAILSLKAATWTGLLPKVKDNITYHVMTIDLATKATTTVLKIENLPFDIDRLVPLSHPLNGCLLLGCNEIIHVDNGGIVRRLAVNKYTEDITASVKNYHDQSDLNLMLENCAVIPIPNDNRVLLALLTGTLFHINFDVDIKTIKRFALEPVLDSHYSSVSLTYPGQPAFLDSNLLFIANSNGNSPLLEVKYLHNEEVTEKVQANGKEDMDGDEELYDDDNAREKVVIRQGDIKYIRHDELINHGPVSDFTLGKYSTEKFKANLINPNLNDVCIVSNGGSHKQSCLNIFAPTVQPIIRSSLTFSQVNRMWNINNKYLITSDDVNLKSEIFQIEKSYSRLKSKDFINDETTIAMHELNNGKYILQITPKHIEVFNSKFKRHMSFEDELKDAMKEDQIISSTVHDDYLMIFFASGEVLIYSVNTHTESLTKINIPQILSDTIITTGYVTNSRLLNAVTKDSNLLIKGTKRKHGGRAAGEEPQDKDVGPLLKMFVLVTGDNRVVAFGRDHNERCYQLNDVDKFSDELNLGFFEPRDTYPDPFIKQVVFNEIGDKHSKEEYLTILTVGGEIYMYKLFFDGLNFKLKKEKDLLITGAPDNAYPAGTSIERRLVYIPLVSGFSSIFVTGVVPYFITRTRHSIPRIFKFTKIAAQSFASFSDSKVSNGLIFLDNAKNARICELPRDFNYDNNLPVKKVPIGETVKSVTYHELSNTYVVSTYREIPYNALDEEGNPIAGLKKDKPSASSYKGSLKLISPYNWTVIETIELRDNEVAMTVKSMVLDIGSSTKRFKHRKELLVVGTGRYRMEDLSANGAFKIYEIIDIIPEPGKPETNHKFKEYNTEDTKGAVTSMCEVSGRFLVAQGQKIIVRDVQDDGVVPVAFLDTSVYVSEAKSFGNLVILGDTLKSVWLAGFDAEPFRMIMLGKDLQTVDVSCAEFISKDEEIYILIAGNNNVMHLVQFDPEDPTSSNGQRLVHRASFNVSSSTTCMRMVPKNEEINTQYSDVFQTIGSTIDGSFFTVFPVNEFTYRRMYIIQQQLTDKEYHYCGLNPRLNRFGGEAFDDSQTGVKPILDHQVIKRYAKLNEDRKQTIAQKVSSKGVYQEIWKDLIEFENVLKMM